LDGVTIDLDRFKIPKTENDLIIEGAGGCLVPLNDNDFAIDLAGLFNCEIILVADLYLGSINHTLLSVDLLKKRGDQVKGIIFNGEPNTESQTIILSHSGYPQLLHIKKEVEINKEVIRHYAEEIKLSWSK
jgi:dethiobiotin synthetase